MSVTVVDVSVAVVKDIASMAMSLLGYVASTVFVVAMGVGGGRG